MQVQIPTYVISDASGNLCLDPALLTIRLFEDSSHWMLLEGKGFSKIVTWDELRRALRAIMGEDYA